MMRERHLGPFTLAQDRHGWHVSVLLGSARIIFGWLAWRRLVPHERIRRPPKRARSTH